MRVASVTTDCRRSTKQCLAIDTLALDIRSSMSSRPSDLIIGKAASIFRDVHPAIQACLSAADSDIDSDTHASRVVVSALLIGHGLAGAHDSDADVVQVANTRRDHGSCPIITIDSDILMAQVTGIHRIFVIVFP